MTHSEILKANREVVIVEITKTFHPSSKEELGAAMKITLEVCEKYPVSVLEKTGIEFKKMIALMTRKAANSNKKSLRELVGAIKEVTGDTRTAAEIRMSHN
jgi:hypothetical protein